jgi:hypothetical protein
VTGVQTCALPICRKFDARGWYTGDGERIERDGVTYAVSNQWGGRQMIEWLDRVLAAFPDHRVSVEAAD